MPIGGSRMGFGAINPRGSKAKSKKPPKGTKTVSAMKGKKKRK